MKKGIFSTQPQTNNSNNTKRGFTIVELLIVIVVIAILAAISIVSFNGIQQRARNQSRIADASAAIKLVSLYIASNGSAPLTIASGSVVSCVGTNANGATGCRSFSAGSTTSTTTANSTLSANLATMGTLPTITAPITRSSTGAGGLGPVYQFRASVSGAMQSVNGVNQARGLIVIYYWLEGLNQNCNAGAPIVTTATANAYTTSTTNYTVSASDRTDCSAIITL